MPIRVTCRCGKRLTAPDSVAGKNGKCPACGAVFLVPQASAPAEAPVPRTQAAPKAAVRPAALVPVAPPPDPARDERILAALRSFLPQNDLYVAPDIPQKKLANAWAACSIPPDERVLGLVNCTVLGSAKNALVFGNRAAYFHNDWTTSPRQGVVAYKEFPSRVFGNAGVTEVSLGGNDKLNVAGSSCSKETVIALLRAVAYAIAGQMLPARVAASGLAAPPGELQPYAGDPALVRLAAMHVPLDGLRMVGGAFWGTAGTAAGRAAKTVLMNVAGAALMGAIGIGFFGWAKKTHRAGIIALADDTLYLLDMGQIGGDDLTLHALKQLGVPQVTSAPLSTLAATHTTERGMGVLQLEGPIALKAYFSDSCTDGNAMVSANIAHAIQAARALPAPPS